MATLLSVRQCEDWKYWVRGGLKEQLESEGVMIEAVTFFDTK